MAKRGTVKHRSVEQEDFIAREYGGFRSTTSGAHDGNDVCTRMDYIECKFEGGPGEKESTGYRVKITELEKIANAAYAASRNPVMAIRLYAPESFLSDEDGNVDIVVRLLSNDVAREAMLYAA